MSLTQFAETAIPVLSRWSLTACGLALGIAASWSAVHSYQPLDPTPQTHTGSR